MLKILTTTLGLGIVATAFVANAQMQMPRQGQMPTHRGMGEHGQMPTHMGMEMGEHGQVHMARPDHMTDHAQMQGRQDHAQVGRDDAVPGPLAALPPANGVSPAPVEGEIIRIDEANGRITLRHEPIPNLEMRAMTMVFRLGDPALLAGLKLGDRVTFEATRVDGAITVTKLEKRATN